MQLPPATRLRREGAEVGRALVHEWRDDRLAGVAAEVAFWTVLSLVPLALALTSSLAFIGPVAGADTSDRARDQLVEWAGSALGERGGAVQAIEELFARSSPGLFTFGLLVALWSSARGFGALIRGLDVVYDLEDKRSWVGRRVSALLLTAGSVAAGALVLAMLVLGPLLGSSGDVADTLGLGSTFATLWSFLRPPFTLAVMVAWAATVFHLGPNHRTPWRWDLPGALLTTVLWVVGSLAFRLYLAVSAGGANAVFGVLGGTLTLPLYVFLLSVSVLVGAELNAVLAERFDVPERPSPESRVRRAVRRRWDAWRAAGGGGAPRH